MDIINRLKALVAEEDGLDIEFPQVYVQPKKPTTFAQGKENITQLLKQIRKCFLAKDGEGFTKSYNALLLEFKPAINWALSCWDYLLTTEGIRYLSRPEGEKLYCHGDYRAFSDKDFNRLIHRVFKECVLSYETKTDGRSFSLFLKKNFWNKIILEYKKLENPPDPRQRKLTIYSYLRCVPYQFFNFYHQEKVNRILEILKPEEKEIVELYFFNFFKEEEILKRKGINHESFLEKKQKILDKISFLDPLVHALLLQIERY